MTTFEFHFVLFSDEIIAYLLLQTVCIPQGGYKYTETVQDGYYSVDGFEILPVVWSAA